jgi:hypothetical protein
LESKRDYEIELNANHPTGMGDEFGYARIQDLLANFKVNLDTIGFDKSVEVIPKIHEPAIIVDNPMTGSIERELPKLKNFRGTVFATDRTLWKLLPHRVPEYVGNVDASYLCMSFFDRPDVREHMDEISALFVTTAFPLTIRAWHGRKYFFTAWMGSLGMTETLAERSKTPWFGTGGNIATTLWILARWLGANPIGLLGFDQCVNKLSESEYPNAPHVKVEEVEGVKLTQPAYVDPTYDHYAWILREYIEYASRRYGTVTVNLQPGRGLMHGGSILDIPLEDFVREKKR